MHFNMLSCGAMALDKQQRAIFVLLPIRGSFELLRLDDRKRFSVGVTHQPPIRPIPGVFFFDAWRLVPQLASDIAIAAVPSDEPAPWLQADTDESGAKTWRQGTLQRERQHKQQDALQEADEYES